MDHTVISVFSCFVAFSIGGLFASVGIGAEVELSRPNIVLIMADDLGYGSLACYGNGEIKTPHLDELASQGMRLTDFHSNGAVCTPTRAALLTGRYPQRCAWVDDAELSPVYQQQRRENPTQRWAWGISEKEVTLPKLLGAAGYRTGLVGKWHLGYDVKFHPQRFGFDEFRGFVGGAVGYHTHHATHGKGGLDWWHGDQIAEENGYTTELLTKHAVEFVNRTEAETARPFFLLLAHAAPHAPWQSRELKSKQSQPEIYREMIEGLDASVGAVLAALRKKGIEKNTVVVFCSDNGAQPPRGVTAGGKMRGKKGSMLEGGHRVPCIATWPGFIPAGKTSDSLVLSMDFLPTLLTIAGGHAPVGHELDGCDVMPMLRGEENMLERAVHWRNGKQWAVRKGAWKLMGAEDKSGELFDLTNDLQELRNLAVQHPALVNELIALHQKWVAEVGER